MINRKTNIYLYFFILIFLYSCGVTKIVKRHKLKDLNIEKIYSEVKANEVNYKTYSIKYSARINLNGKQNNVSGIIRIKRDSAIWVSVTPGFGVEVMRLLATPDSVKLLNKLNTTYLQETIVI